MFRLSLLSVSLLTVMAGAAVAPGLAEIFKVFPAAGETQIKMMVTLPPLVAVPVIVITGMMIARLQVSKRKMLIIGLIIYIIGGAGAGFTGTVTTLLAFRILLGIGAGIIIPLATGLIGDCYSGQERTRMMGLASAANNLGAILGNIGAGFLVMICWRYMFSVYLIALPVLILAIIFLKDLPPETEKQIKSPGLPASVYGYATVGFLIMVAFFAIVTNLSLLVESRGIGDSRLTGLLFAFNTLCMFVSGVSLASADKIMHKWLPAVMLAFMAVGYGGLAVATGAASLVLSITAAGIGTGWAFPLIINRAVSNLPAGRNVSAMTVVMSSVFLGQFVSPLLLDCYKRMIHGSMSSVFLLLSALLALSSIILLIAHWKAATPVSTDHVETQGLGEKT